MFSYFINEKLQFESNYKCKAATLPHFAIILLLVASSQWIHPGLYWWDILENSTNRSYSKAKQSKDCQQEKKKVFKRLLSARAYIPITLSRILPVTNTALQNLSTIKMIRCNFCIMTFKILEVKLVWESFSSSGNSHWFKKCLSYILKVYDQSQTSSSILLFGIKQ